MSDPLNDSTYLNDEQVRTAWKMKFVLNVTNATTFFLQYQSRCLDRRLGPRIFTIWNEFTNILWKSIASVFRWAIATAATITERNECSARLSSGILEMHVQCEWNRMYGRKGTSNHQCWPAARVWFTNWCWNGCTNLHDRQSRLERECASKSEYKIFGISFANIC